MVLPCIILVLPTIPSVLVDRTVHDGIRDLVVYFIRFIITDRILHAVEEAQKIKEKYLLLENYRAKSEVVSNVLHNIDVFSIEAKRYTFASRAR